MIAIQTRAPSPTTVPPTTWDSTCPADPRGHDWHPGTFQAGAFVLEVASCDDCGAVCASDCRWDDLPWQRDTGSVEDLVEEA